MDEHVAIPETREQFRHRQSSFRADKQLAGVRLQDVLEKRDREQALNAKEFAVLVGVSYSVTRAWFRLDGFPLLRGHVFWRDFVKWRQIHVGLEDHGKDLALTLFPKGSPAERTPVSTGLPKRALKILSDQS